MSFSRRYLPHLYLLQRFLLKTVGWKKLDSEVAGGGKDSQQTQLKTKNPIVRTGRPVLSEQQSVSSVQEIKNFSNLTAKAPMKEQGDLFSSCVPMSVKRSDQDKDENVIADPVRTGRLVYEQPSGLFTQYEDIDIDFRVSGLPHAIVKQAENFRVRELVKKIESHLIVELFKPICNKVMLTTHLVKNQRRRFVTWAM